eukprot:gene28000-36879_t
MIRYNSAWTENYIPKHKATVGTFDRLEVAQSNFIRSFQDKSARRKFFCFISTILGFDLFSAHLSLPVIADSSSWTDRNRLAAETWRAVDEGYLDRTFGGQDWFKLRQEVVKKNYKSDEELYQSLTTMVSKLGDKYTRFLNPAQYSALLSSATGQLTGIGVELEVLVPSTVEGKSTTLRGTTVVARTEDGSPAQEAGLLRGDIILNVDGTPADKLSPEEIAALSRGKEGTKASYQVARGDKIIDIQAIRRPITLKGTTSGQAELVAQNGRLKGRKIKVGFVKVRSFSSTTKDEVTKALEAMHSGPGDRPEVLLIDLRNNGGGLLQGAVETSNLLLKPGKIAVFVVSKDGQPQALQTLPNGIDSSDPELPDLTTPVYLLVDSNTASAAEVFAAAMRENDREGEVKLVGEKTFGKGIIQNLQPLREGGVAVTVARYETPQHHNINKVGINVDIAVSCEASSESTIDCAAKFL